MATDYIDSVAFTLSTAAAGNTQDITISGFGSSSDIIGFQIYVTANVTADDTLTSDNHLSVGFCDGTNQQVTGYYTEDGADPTETRRLHRSDAVIFSQDGVGGTTLIAFSFNSFITDGIRLDIDTASGSAYKGTLVLIRGASGSDCFVGAHDDLGTSATTTSITGVGFTSDWVTMICSGNSAAVPNSTAQALMCLGMWINDGVDSQVSASISSNDNQANVQSQAYVDIDDITGQAISGTRQWIGNLDNVGSDGFDITTNASSGSDIISFMCVKWGGSPETALFQTTIPTSSPYAETGAGFSNTVDFGMMTSIYGVASVGSLDVSTVYGLTLSTFNSSAEQSISLTSDDAEAVAVEKSAHNDEIKIYSFDGSTAEVVVSGVTLDSDGWDMTLSTTPTDQVFGWGFAFAEDPTSAAITGTATASINEDDIVTGGKTIIITLTGDTFKAAGTGPIGTTAESQALLDGLDSAQSELLGWNNEVRDNLVPADDLVRTSSTVATITLPASANYDITAQETITVTVPTDVLVTAAGAITGAPTFTVDIVSGVNTSRNLLLLGVG